MLIGAAVVFSWLAEALVFSFGPSLGTAQAPWMEASTPVALVGVLAEEGVTWHVPIKVVARSVLLCANSTVF